MKGFEPGGKSRGRWVAGAAALVCLDVLYRLPGLLRLDGILSSDTAVVGLQAVHLLRGEHARLLWGASYQGTLEPYLAAAAFFVKGPTPAMLSVTSMLGHIVLVLLAWSTLRRHLEPAKAWALCGVLVFAPQAINTMAVLPQPRIWSVVLVFAAVALIDLATPLALAAGLFVGMLGLWADLFAMQLMLPVLVFACFCVSSRRHALAVALGLALGILAVVQLRVGTRVFAGPGGFGLHHVAKNAALLWGDCLPMILGAKVYDPELWVPPAAWRFWQLVGATALVLGIVSAGPLALARQRLPWEQRRLGLLGAGAGLATVLGFLPSGSPIDVWAARYLVGLVFFAPFALVPLAASFTLRGLCAAVLVPYLSVAAVSGLRAWGPLMTAPASAQAELLAYLKANGVTHAKAHFWLSYRLTFLWKEEVIVTPLEGTRYRPYDEGFERARRIAYFVHPSVPDVTAEQLPKENSTAKTANVGGFTVLLYDREE